MESTADPPASLPLHTRLRKVLGRIRRRFEVHTFDVFARPVPTEPGFEAPEGYELRWGSAEDVEACDEHHTELDARERREGCTRISFDHRVVMAFHEGTAVFSMWVNPRNLNVPGLVKRRLAPDQWFIYKAFTSPEHRGKKLYVAGMAFVLDEMRERGLRELVGYAHVKKKVSRKGLARLDFGTLGRLQQVDTPFLKRTFLSKELTRAFPEAVARSGAIPAP